MKKIGISCKAILARYGIERGLAICKKSGFDAVDFNLEAYRLGDAVYGGSEDAFLTYFDGIRKTAELLELEISQTHGIPMRTLHRRIDEALTRFQKAIAKMGYTEEFLEKEYGSMKYMEILHESIDKEKFSPSFDN